MSILSTYAMNNAIDNLLAEYTILKSQIETMERKIIAMKEANMKLSQELNRKNSQTPRDTPYSRPKGNRQVFDNPYVKKDGKKDNKKEQLPGKKPIGGIVKMHTM